MTQKRVRPAAQRSTVSHPAAGSAAKAAAPRRRTQKKRPNWLQRILLQRPLAAWLVLLVDIALVGAALLVFALFHHVLPKSMESTGIVSTREQAAVLQTALPEETPVPTVEPAQQAVQPAATATAVPAATAEPEPVGYFGTKYASRFNEDGSVEITEDSYVSGNLNIKIREFEDFRSDVYFADIYVKDISSIQNIFGEGKYGRSYTERVKDMARDADAVLAVNGDYYGTREDGVVIRNGELYRDDETPKRDVLVLYWDGSVEVFTAGEFDAEAVMAKGAYQAWTFGPNLLNEDGEALSGFRDVDVYEGIAGKDPRTVFGYFQPGHYALVVVDGRSDDSRGVMLDELAQLMESLGCKIAYNLDGGNSSVMVFNGETLNNPSKGGRESSDAILIMDGQ